MILATGPHRFSAQCPSCRQHVVMLAEIHARLTVVAGKSGELRLGCTSKPLPHDCTHLIDDVPLPGMAELDDDAAEEREVG